MKFSKPSIQFIKPIFQINHFSSQKLHLDDVGPMASLLKTRSVIRIRGPDTVTFLRGLLTNDLRKFGEPVGDEKSPNSPASSARSLYAAMLMPQGRFLYDMFLYEPPRTGSVHDELELLADVDCSVLDELVETLKKHRLKSKVDFENVGESFSCWQRYGVDLHKSVEDSQAASVSTSNSTGWQWHKDPRLDCLGFRGIFPSNTIPPLVEADTETEEENYLLWRIEKGVAEGSIEIPKGTAMPLEYNLAGLNAISFDKGCFVGQEFIARNLYYGDVRKRLFPIIFLDESGNGIIFLDESGNEVSQKVAPNSEVMAVESGRRAGTVRLALGSRGLAVLRLSEAYWLPGDLVIKGEEDVKVEAFCPEWWPLAWIYHEH